MNEKKQCAIVFGLTSNLTFALANVLLGMKSHCSIFWDDIIVFHDAICVSEQEHLNSILKCKFIKYDESYITVNIDKHRLRTYSILTLSRFECFNLLNDYKKVIWHDVDILIQKDFKGLLDYANKSGIALTCDPTFMVEQNFNGIIDNYALLKPLYNAGIMVISDKLKNYVDLSKYCYNKFNKYNEKLRYMDQSVLNMMIQDYNYTVENIDLNIYCCHPNKDEYLKKAVIVHSYGSEKFWNNENLKRKFPEWVSNNFIWEDISSKNIGKINNYELPVVSVIMSVYDRMDFLDDAIRSILNQTFQNFEFIIVIEYSSNQEKIYNYIKGYNDNRIKIVLNSEKLGFPLSLNVGLDIAKGKYIARMDDDDISIPERFEKQVNFMDENSDITVVGSFMKMFMNSDQLCEMPLDNEGLLIRSLTESPMYHPTVMIRKDHLVKYNMRYNPDFFAEDYALWSEMLNNGLKLANIPEILHYFRASGQNATATKQQQVLNSHIETMRINFYKNLKLNFTYDQLLLLRNPNLVHSCFNSKEFVDLRNKAVEDIIISNSILKRYNQERLKKYFNSNLEVNFKNRIKYKLNNYPLFYRIAKNIYKFFKTITNRVSLNSIEKNIGEKNMSIFKKIKMKLFPPSSKSFHNRMDDIDGKLDIILDKMNNSEIRYNHIIDRLDAINKKLNVVEEGLCLLKTDSLKRDEKVLNKINNLYEKNYAKVSQTIMLNQKLYLEQMQNINKHIIDYSTDNLSDYFNSISNNIEKSFNEQEKRCYDILNKITESERWIVREIRANRFDVLFKLDKELLNNNKNGQKNSIIYNKWFYLNNRYGSFISGFQFLKNIIPTFKIKSIVDFGCGTGTWLAAAKSISEVEVLGIDGEYVSKDDLMIDESEFLPSDLTCGVMLGKKYDLAISVEVAEHLPVSASDTLVRDLCRASDIVLFSAAHVGQGGDGHINCQPFEFWQEKFLNNNFHYINIREQFKDNWEIEGWYRENISLFISSDRLGDFEASSNFYKGTL